MSGWTDGVRREVLPNGLTLLAQRIPGAPAIAVVSSVRAGFFDEPDRIAGVSHVLEHMLFKGTPTRGVGDIPREVKSAGGSINAGTGYDHTSYVTVLPPGELAIGLELLSDALRHSTLDPEELRRELIVILEEARRKLDSPAAVAAETLHALLFDQHRIRRWRIGTEEQLARMTRADVVEFYQAYYVPAETIVAVTGELDPLAACDAARAFFGDWPARPPSRDLSPAEPDRREVRARTIRGDVTRGDLAIGWRTVGRHHPDAIPLDLASLVLSGGRSSWLYRRVRVPGAMTVIGSSHFTPREVGVFTIAGELDPVRLGDALTGIAECIARLRDQGPDHTDLLRVRTLLQAGWARRLQTAEGRAHALVAAEMDGDYRLLDEDYSRLLSVGPEEVQRVAEEWLDPDRVAGVVYWPEDQGEDLSAEQLRVAMRPEAGVRSPERKALPPSSGLLTPDSLQHLALPGADLLVQRKPGVPLVSLGLFQRRHRIETAEDAGLAALATRAAIRGAGGEGGDQDAAGLALAFERLGGVLGPVATSEWTGFSTSVLAEHAGEAARLLDQVFRFPKLLTGEVETERKTLRDAVLQDADDMSRHPIELAFRARFGRAGYGLPVAGLPESVERLGADLVRAWHRQMLEVPNRRPVLIAVGALDPERFAGELAPRFERYPPRREDWTPIASPPPSGETGVLAEERAKRQTALAMLFPGPDRRSPGRFAAEVWSAMAGGLGGRLFMALRDRLSLAYVVRASIWQRSGAGALLAYLATSPEREEEARAAMRSELARFGEAPPDPAELGRAIRYLTGQILIGRQTAGAVAAEIAEAWLSRGEAGLAELEDPTAGIRAVSGEAIERLARDAFGEPGFEGIVRGVGEPAMFRAGQ